jgi:iron complex outermembrane receptor protein
VRSIPDALRLAPGLQVSQTNMNQFQIGIRGQTDFWTDLLLVMVDGRPIYNTTFSGVWWVAQNYPLEDIDRIEIVRGPGGAVWGSNAVNGVINIITKQAGASQGLRISGGGGTEDKGFGNVSFGSNVGNLDYRIYSMRETRDGGLAERNLGSLGYIFGEDAPDFRRMKQHGFRLDWDANESTLISLHGDAYQIATGQIGDWMPNPTPGNGHEPYAGLNGFSGKNIVFRIEKELIPDITVKGQLFYDQYKVHTQIIREKKESFDGDFQVDFADVLYQNISLGVNIRRLQSRFHNTPQFQMPTRTTKLTSFFINDELSLFDGLFRITGGVKMERNAYAGWEYQPSVRAIVSDDQWALWVATSKAVRMPNDMENGLLWNRKRSGGRLIQQTGAGDMQTEDVLSYEAGARLRPTENSLIEITGYRIIYKGVPDTWQFRNGQPLIYPEYLTNVLNGKGDGVEANFRYQPWDWITLKGSYTYLHQYYQDYPIKDGETKWTVRSNNGQDPRNRFHMGVSLNPLNSVELDANLFFTGPFREGDILGQHRLDMRLGWKPVDGLEISIVGQDMLRYSHEENTGNSMAYSSLIQQRYYMQATYTYD